ncbi:major facilitator superfamily domain-containing protein [Xylaria sp. FL0043]|nr:major facilitator superfamily domain-containing protein [Xylaria sp. FL0043]
MAGPSTTDERLSDDETAAITEQTPFIFETRATSDSYNDDQQRLRRRRSPFGWLARVVPKAEKPGTIVFILCVVIFVGSASSGFQNMPMTRIFEDILCRQYYDQIHSHNEPIDEDMCKVDAIQSKLAYLFAIMSSLNAGVSVLAALPWGIAADRIGRRPVFAMGLIGMSIALLWIMVVGWFSQTLPPRLIWLSPIFYLLGGGNPVLSATIISMTTDVVPESQRSVSFMQIHGASMVGNLIAPALASILMARTGPWPPLFLAFLLTVLPALAVFLVPESLKHAPQNDDDDDNQLDSKFKASLAQTLRELKKSAKVFASRSMIIILLITMLQLSLIQSTFQFLSQFTSKRYHIPIADTGYIQSIYGVAFIIISFLAMPWITSVVVKPGALAFLCFDDDKRRDLFLARTSYLASMTGTFILGLSWSLPGFIFGLVILAFGVSSEGFLKQIATLHVTAEQRTRLFTILGLSAIASDLWVAPALAALFSLGMRLGGIWIGLPYFGLSGLCVLMFVLALFLRLPSYSRVDEESDSDERPGSE